MEHSSFLPEVEIESSGLDSAEIDLYAKRAAEMIENGTLPRDLCRMEICADGEEVEIRYYARTDRDFDRIRRVTGYLVGTLKRFNDAKRAEERDRIKHGM